MQRLQSISIHTPASISGLLTTRGAASWEFAIVEHLQSPLDAGTFDREPPRSDTIAHFSRRLR